MSVADAGRGRSAGVLGMVSSGGWRGISTIGRRVRGSGGPRRNTSAGAGHGDGCLSGGAIVLNGSGRQVSGGLGSLHECSGMSQSGNGSLGDVSHGLAGGDAVLNTIDFASGLSGSGADRRRDSDSDGNASRAARHTGTVSVSLRLRIEKLQTYLELEAATAPALP